MTDTEIIELYWTRSENAVGETARQYGSYCTAIAMNILGNREDAEECVNDTYLSAWDNIPPQRPAMLSAYLGRITRNLSLDKYKARSTKKRGAGEAMLLLSELEDCIPSGHSTVDEVEGNVLGELIDHFLSKLNVDDRAFFVRRYWYAEPVCEIAKRYSASESRIKTSLFRTRKKLKLFLEREWIAP